MEEKRRFVTDRQDYERLCRNVYHITLDIEDPSKPDMFEGDTDLRDDYLEQLGNFPCDFDVMPLTECFLTTGVEALINNTQGKMIDNHLDDDVVIEEFPFLDSHIYIFKFYDSRQIVYPPRYTNNIIKFEDKQPQA